MLAKIFSITPEAMDGVQPANILIVALSFELAVMWCLSRGISPRAVVAVGELLNLQLPDAIEEGEEPVAQVDMDEEDEGPEAILEAMAEKPSRLH